MENKFNIEESLTKLLKQANVSYLGKTTHSAKMNYSYKNGTETYCIYLAPSTMTYGETRKDRNVCPNDKFCKAFCLNGSGHNKSDILARGIEHSKINQSRIKKTKLFFENKELFMKIMILEILKAKIHAKLNGMEFAVRINGTSDLSPEDFMFNGLNILQLFEDVTFYDYTKVPSRLDLINKYPNYDLTLSYNGHNWGACDKFLKMGGRVSVVFDTELPIKFHGYRVIDGNNTDTRFLDPNQVIVGLHYHRTANDYKNGSYNRPNTRFIIRENDVFCEW